MYSFQQASPTPPRPQHDQRSFQRVSVNLPGRLMLPNHDEYECTVIDMSPGDVNIACHARPQRGERIIAYVDHLGRIEGTVEKASEFGFVIVLNATDRKREKLAAQLTWLANKHELGLPEDRRHNRLTPRNTRTELVLDDGRRYPCRIIDLSLSGAAIDIEVRPALGTPVQLGNMRGRVVRHFQEGVAVEFSSVQSKEALTSFL
ncbi:PilZ domain-containing protein [Sinorhizobium sp. BG8]|uniref:PilZ domain-containing protein n=1 Tax=Sinorhizobium sp. BG8 TaxID=2613773 RepID=UPI00193D76E7|nr:PilZ domain-containing protein [Sinorhizobium sp. BG8]QRM56927.1 PilZ domain-containing protein [Sinorhizobium sp. BG8]